MNLAGLQSYVVARLQASAALQGVPVLAHDGTDGFVDTSKERSNALTTPTVGVCITVTQILFERLIQPGGTGESDAVILSIGLAVFIEENIRISRTTGLNLPAENILQHVFAAVLGPIEGEEAFGSAIGLADPPFDNLGSKGGVQAFVASFTVPLTIIPTS